jgi:protein TonB
VTSKLIQGALWLTKRLFVGLAAALLSLAVFLVLPLIQTIGGARAADTLLRSVDVAELPPPPPPPPPMEEPEPEPEPEPPPELTEEAPPLDLSQIELALNPGMGDGGFGDFTVKLVDQLGEGGGSEELDEIFSLADLDQRPRVIFQRKPTYPPALRRSKRQGTVTILFKVDTSGRVVDPSIAKSTDSAFDEAALEAVRQWRFEPGTRNGQPVQFRMKIPITFNAT